MPRIRVKIVGVTIPTIHAINAVKRKIRKK